MVETTEQEKNREKLEAHIAAYGAEGFEQTHGELADKLFGDLSEDYFKKVVIRVLKVFAGAVQDAGPIYGPFSLWMEGVALGKTIAEAEALEKSFAKSS